MKAKELYAQYLIDLEQSNRLDATYKLLKKMSEEIQQIAKKRGAEKDDAIASIFAEQNRKWNAICKLDKSFKRNGFLVLWKKNIPDLEEFFKESA